MPAAGVPPKLKCIESEEGQSITRWYNEAVLEEMELRVRSSPEKVNLLETLAELDHQAPHGSGAFPDDRSGKHGSGHKPHEIGA